MSRAIKCPCGHRACTAWMVDPEAAVQGVRFTQEEAELVASLLNKYHATEPPEATSPLPGTSGTRTP